MQWDTGTCHHKHLIYYMSDSELDFVSETFYLCHLFKVLTSRYMVTKHSLGNHGPNVGNSKTLKGKNKIFLWVFFTKFSTSEVLYGHLKTKQLSAKLVRNQNPIPSPLQRKISVSR